MLDTDFGRYELEAELARGACGIVYRARDRELDRLVALKTPRQDDLSPVSRGRFLRESRLAARLEHPGIVPVLGAGEHAGRPYYVMSLLEGASLRGPLPPAEACRIIREVAEALAFAHARGIIHRDLKPSNLLICAGHPVLTDFGVARAEGDLRMTENGELVGTPAYMAPELLQGRAHEAGPAADLWSLGVIFFELLSGRLPFEGDNFVELSSRTLNDPVPELAGVDPALSHWVRRCLSRDPDGRPSARELASALASGGNLPRRSRVLPASLAMFALAGALWARPDPDETPGIPGMSLVPAGRFTIGDPRFGRRSVELDAFWIDRDEAPARAAGWTFLDAAAYCLKQGKRLPSEEEWEAAAGGTLFPWGETPDPARASCGGVRGGNPRDLSPAGCRDMAGGLAEWTSTPGTAGEGSRIVRGGSWTEPIELCTTWARRELPVNRRLPTVGFRCALASPPR